MNPHTTERDAKILKNAHYPRSNNNKAKRLRMSLEDYLERKHFLLNQQGNAVVVIKDNYIADLENKIVEQRFDVEKQTGTITGVMSYEAQSPEDIIKEFKIDTTKWRLATYWNKKQPNGTYLVSANVAGKKVTDQDVIAEDMLAAIKSVFAAQDIRPYTYIQQESNDKSLMVYTSDKHIGAVVPDNALYVNTFNADAFADRMYQLLEEIFYLETIYGTFENIYIMDLGDALDGWNGMTTRTGHTLPQNMDNRKSFETYLRTHKDFFDNLLTSGVANNYFFKAVTNDNHSADFGYVTNRALEEYLNVKYPQVDTQIMSKFIEHFVQGKHTFVLNHGKDDCDMKHGLPLHLNDKTINFINNYLDENDINSKTSKVHFVKGDLHQDCSEGSTRFRYRNTCSMFGSSKWAMHNFLPQAPGVSFDIIENNTKRVFPYTLQLNATKS